MSDELTGTGPAEPAAPVSQGEGVSSHSVVTEGTYAPNDTPVSDVPLAEGNAPVEVTAADVQNAPTPSTADAPPEFYNEPVQTAVSGSGGSGTPAQVAYGARIAKAVTDGDEIAAVEGVPGAREMLEAEQARAASDQARREANRA